MESRSIIRYTLGGAKIKYNILSGLMDKNRIKGSEYKSCVLLVDAHAIFTKLLQSRNLPLYDGSLEETVIEIVVNFYNVIGHYRRYIAQHLQLNNDIFVSYNREVPEFQRMQYPKYLSKHLDRYDQSKQSEYSFIVRALDKAWEFICSISPYFEGIYCIDMPKVDDFTVLATASGWYQLDHHVLKLILTRNAYAYQMLYSRDTFLLYPKRDDSYIVRKDNLFSRGVLHGTKSDLGIKADGKLTPTVLPMMWAFAGLAEVDVEKSPFSSSSTLGPLTRTTMKIFDRPGNTYKCSNWTFQDYVSLLTEVSSLNKDTVNKRFSTLKRRYYALNHGAACAATTSDQVAKIRAQLIDLFDENELESLNDILGRNSYDPSLFDIQNLNMAYGEVL